MSDRKCPDDGTCHHGCPPTECFRVRVCAPFTRYGEDWKPEDVEKFGGAPVSPTVEDIIVAGTVALMMGEEGR